MTAIKPGLVFSVNVLMLKIHNQIQTEGIQRTISNLQADIKIVRYDSLSLGIKPISPHELRKVAEVLDQNCTDSVSTYRACLSHALTFHFLMACVPVSSVFVIGVMHDGAKLLSHAWVDVPGSEAIDTGNMRCSYTPIYQFEF